LIDPYVVNKPVCLSLVQTYSQDGGIGEILRKCKDYWFGIYLFYENWSIETFGKKEGILESGDGR
jgi:hypothetical protein